MSELLMKDVRKKFANAREACPGMSEEVYAITDYLSAVANDILVPSGIVMMLVCVMDDLDRGRCGFGRQIEFPEYLATHTLQVRAQMPYVLQVVDAIADEAFANEVRTDCKEAFSWDIAKRVTVTDDITVSDNINAAVGWWAEAIQHPKMDNGDDQLSRLMIMLGGGKNRQYTADEIKRFRKVLADSIAEEMAHSNRVTLSVDYNPDRLLGKAGDAIGLGQFDFPCKTTMWVSENEVSVRAGYGASPEVIWSAST